MEFVKDLVPLVEVMSDDKVVFSIKSTQELDEQDDRVYLRCAEYVNVFKRGFVCDLNCVYELCDMERKNTGKDNILIRDLVLVHVNKSFDIDSFPQFEYVFYK